MAGPSVTPQPRPLFPPAAAAAAKAPTPPPPFNMGVRPATVQSNIYGLQGAPNSGKTTGALSFPNPLVLDYDKKLPPGARCVEFWNADYISELCKPLNGVPNRRDALKVWLKAVKDQNLLTADDTLVVDSFSRISDNFDLLVEADPTPYLSKKGEVDGFEVFRQKGLYFKRIFDLFQVLPCRVVITFHETIDRDDKGLPNGKLRPLVSGQFADQVAGFCSNFFRCNCKEVGGKLVYTWQIRSNNLFNAIRGPEYQFPDDKVEIEVPYNKGWSVLESFRRKAA